jgi:hypothetical protein
MASKKKETKPSLAKRTKRSVQRVIANVRRTGRKILS